MIRIQGWSSSFPNSSREYYNIDPIENAYLLTYLGSYAIFFSVSSGIVVISHKIAKKIILLHKNLINHLDTRRDIHLINGCRINGADGLHCQIHHPR